MWQDDGLSHVLFSELPLLRSKMVAKTFVPASEGVYGICGGTKQKLALGDHFPILCGAQIH